MYKSTSGVEGEIICCLIGTRAQLIKMAPLMRLLEQSGHPLRLIFSGQHKVMMADLYTEFELKTSPEWIYQGEEVSGIWQVVPWFFHCCRKLWRQRQHYLSSQTKIVLVHGDTFSTLLGALAGRLAGIPVGHIESGLRSFKIFHPFPEEITRILVSRLSKIAFCPDAKACQNLAHLDIEKFNTEGNTLADALKLALHRPLLSQYVANSYAVVSLHRFENIFQSKRLQLIINLLEIASQRWPLVFVLHPATERNLRKFGFFESLQSNPNISLCPRLGYFDFVKLLVSAKFVITDGGSNQEELFYLGKPTLLMRRATERQEGMKSEAGIASTAVLCAYDADILERFLADLAANSEDVVLAPNFPLQSPSQKIMQRLLQY